MVNIWNVSFLHGKSVSRMKSFFRAVKCFFWVSHLHLKWTFVARACEGLQGSTRGANGSRIKNILGKEKWFHEQTFYKLRMELCSMITGIVCFQWRKQWRKPFLHRFLHSWRKQWRKILKQWNQFSNPWKKTGKTWSNSSQNWTKIDTWEYGPTACHDTVLHHGYISKKSLKPYFA